MSGANYNVSVLQVMESERKLKILNFLSLAASDGVSLRITDLASSLDDTEKQYPDDDNLDTNKFENVLSLAEQKPLSNEDVRVLMYIAGYIAHSVQKKLKCQACTSRLTLDKLLHFENNEKCDYLKVLDRGGLK